MVMTEKKFSRGVAGRFKTWLWFGLAALSGLLLSAPVLVGRWRRRIYKRKENR